jgi:dihydrofolate reductase
VRQLQSGVDVGRKGGKDIWLWGSLTLMGSLLEAGVVDEVRMLICPVSRGKGARVFEDRRDLRLVEATEFENGLGCCATRSRIASAPAPTGRAARLTRPSTGRRTGCHTSS